MADAEWEVHKAEIKRLYLRENKKLEAVLQFMEKTRGFRKTKNQYTARLKKWGFKKYRMGAIKWRHVNREMQKRAAEGQNLEVWFDGVYYPQKTVQFEIHRQGFQREIDKYRRESLSPTPEGLIVCSPGPSILQITWPPNLPWFIFSNIALSRLQNGHSNSSISLGHLPGVQEEELPSKVIERGLINSLGSLMIGNHAKVLRTGRNISRVAAALSSIMPEQNEGQNLHLAERLCSLRGGSDAVERLQVALFLLSNGFEIGEPDECSRSNISLDGYSDDGKLGEPRISKEDQTIMAIFYLSGLDTVSNLEYLLSLPGATAHAISHKLFASAVRSQDIRTVRMALEAGMSPDTPIFHEGLLMPPLILVSSFRDPRAALDMCNLFFSYGSGLKDTEVMEGAFCKAIRSRNIELVKTFLARNIPISGKALGAAIETGAPDLLSVLLDVDPDINKRASGAFSILGLAVYRNDASLTKYLLGLGADVDAIDGVRFSENGFFTSTTLGLAIREGNDDIIDLLLEAHPNINHQEASDRYIPPIVLSVGYGATNLTRRLLSAGADVSTGDGIQGMTLVQRALERDDLELSRLLISHGAGVEPTQMEDYYTSILYENVAMNNLDTAISLLSWGARKDEIYREAPDTILGAAIAGGHCEMIESLLQAGATNTGQRLIQIGNLKTAIYLEQLGLLPEIFHRYGQPILVSAIINKSWRKDDGLVQYLLDRNVDKQPKNVGLKPFAMTAKSSKERPRFSKRWPGWHLHLFRVCTSPLEAAIGFLDFPERLSFAKILIERGASIGDLELTRAVDQDQFHPKNSGILQLLLDNLSRQPCAVPNAFGRALQYDPMVVRRFLEIDLDPGGKVVADSRSDGIFLYQLHGTIDYTMLGSILEIAVTCRDGGLFRTLLHARTWTAVEKGRALTTALYYKRKARVEDLLSSGADVNQGVEIERNAYPPLWLAVEKQDIFLTRHFIALGADIEWSVLRMPNGKEQTILSTAVQTRNRHIVKVLLDAGVNINRPASSYHGKTALQDAVEEGSAQIVDMLLDAGADPNQDAAEFWGGTALQFAAIKGYIGIARKLLAKGADVDAGKSLRYGRTALEGAAEHGRIEMLQLLLNEGASIEGRGRRQYIRAIKLAESNAEFGAAKLLRDHGFWTGPDARQYEHEKFDFHEKRWDSQMSMPHHTRTDQDHASEL
ncbi:ankyrin [Penicillium canariense]|uniref:Ankyrin n=1 Tax=Penicillium canariense TaxID=189055 RepID=A0A9W9I8R9_9EURO|nr:ankyrin [Penicillium canariense]KAJ5168859.1 ankyrin [Penicillium canariense]